MYLSLDWLKDFVDIPKNITPEELGLRLTNHTVEIDGVEKQADKLKGVVIGKIIEIGKHPNADRLQITKVDIGKEKLEIVCGAPNIEIGQLVPVALVGTVLPASPSQGGPNNMEIKEAEVRGVKSCGMLCAEDELGLGDDHEGIMILSSGKLGQSLGEYLKLKDVIYEVDNKSITHRADLWSHYGMAREISAFLKTKFKEYKQNNKILLSKKESFKLKVKIEDYQLCPRYMGICLDGVKIGPSPEWMQKRLIAVGMRPINNVVDVTNYIMLEFGQPLHAFDSGLVDKIIVRRAKKNERIETLDDETRELDQEMLVIANSKKPVAIAGIMGGANSEISEDTKSIIIEAANFNFLSIRKTAQKLGLRTESAIRFEKALDPNLCETAIIRAVELIKDFCPQAQVISNLADEKKFKLKQGPIEINIEWLQNRIGKEIDKNEISNILAKLGFPCDITNDKLKIEVPTWRAVRDVSIPEDIVEEIARIYGYNNLNQIMPKIGMEPPLIIEELSFKRKIKEILSGSVRATEVYNYSFVGEEQLKKLKIDIAGHVRLANPIASHQSILRKSLMPNLLENVKTNQARFEKFCLYEIGNVFFNSPGSINKNNSDKDKLPYQEDHLGLVCAGNSQNGDMFNELKGIVSHLLKLLGLTENYNQAEIILNWAETESIASIMINNKEIGYIAKIKKDIAVANGLKKDIAVVEISLKELFEIFQNKTEIKYDHIPKHPPVIRDLAFVVKDEVLYNNIKTEIIKVDELIKKVELFDVYVGQKLGVGKKNLAFNITYQADRTLTSNEVDKIQKQIAESLKKKFDAQLRNF